MKRYSHLSGAVLSGGKSSRYGRNKAFARLNGQCLIDRVVQCLGQVFEHLVIITNSPSEYAYLKIPIIKDVEKGLGPIVGIYSALLSMSGEGGFFVACDMPQISTGLLRYMVEEGAGFDAVVPRVDGKTEPLHAIYTKACIPAIREAIDQGILQTNNIYSKISIRYIEEEEILPFDPQLKSFVNINRPQDLRRLELP